MNGVPGMVDSGLIVVGLITMGYIVLVITLLCFVKYEWCDLLFKNNTENPDCRRQYSKDTFFVGAGSSLREYANNHTEELHGKHKKYLGKRKS